MNILTEEELKEWETETRELLPVVSDYRIKKLISVVRINKHINKSLVAENDEQTAEIENLKLEKETLSEEFNYKSMYAKQLEEDKFFLTAERDKLREQIKALEETK